MEEIWKDIPGYEGLYQASSFGKIKSLFRIDTFATKKSNKGYIKRPIKERVLKPYKINSGYYCVDLCNSGNKVKWLLHKLIILTFIPNNKGKKCANHINGIKTDNRIENLEWVTHSENNNHAYEKGLMKKGRYRTDSKTVALYKENRLVNKFDTVKEASLFLNVTTGSVSSACRLKHKCCGYTVKYL